MDLHTRKIISSRDVTFLLSKMVGENIQITICDDTVSVGELEEDSTEVESNGDDDEYHSDSPLLDAEDSLDLT